MSKKQMNAEKKLVDLRMTLKSLRETAYRHGERALFYTVYSGNCNVQVEEEAKFKLAMAAIDRVEVKIALINNYLELLPIS